jgi:hypothetical protein
MIPAHCPRINCCSILSYPISHVFPLSLSLSLSLSLCFLDGLQPPPLPDPGFGLKMRSASVHRWLESRHESVNST